MKRIRLACFLFALFLASIVYAADAGIAKPVFDFVRSLPMGDKISHFFLMGTLACLANLALGCQTAGSRRFFPGWGTMIVSIVVVAEEVSQIWIPGRTFELLDLTADFLGILSGETLARIMSRSARRAPHDIRD